MQLARIAELLEPFVSQNSRHSEQGQRPSEESAFLAPAQLQCISTYIDILQRWNARINLTAIRDEEQIVTRHFGESLFAAQHLFPRSSSVCSPVPYVLKGFAVDSKAESPKPAARVADLGSGAGFPGIPIKLWAPEISLTLIESNHKKVTFLREIIRALTLTNVNVFPGRAGQLADTTEPATFDLVTLRAVERFSGILPVAAALLPPGGRLALLIGSSQVSQARSLMPAIEWAASVPIPQSQSRIVMIGIKAKTTSEK